MKHTPIPWIFYKNKLRPKISDVVIIEIQDQKGKAIIKWPGFEGVENRDANARFIIAACNNFEVLIQSCREAFWQSHDPEVERMLREAVYKVEAALLGIIYNGLQETAHGGGIPLFTDLETRATFVLRSGETLPEALARKRAEFKK
jgi:hypothetical protein